MSKGDTTTAVQRCLDESAGNSPTEPIVRTLLERVARRLHLLCATLLYRNCSRLTPLENLQADEVLVAVAERLLRPLREARHEKVCQFSRWPTSKCAASSMTWPGA
jgi:hypothetical protein